MAETSLQKLNEISDDKVALHSEPWSGEARRPPPPPVHPRARDVHLRSLEIKVVRHRANGHKVGDKGFIVLDPRRWRVEQEFITCLPDPFPQNPEPFYRFRRVPKIKYCDRSELWQWRV